MKTSEIIIMYKNHIKNDRFGNYCLYDEINDVYYEILSYSCNEIIVTDWIGGSKKFNIENEDDLITVNNMKFTVHDIGI